MKILFINPVTMQSIWTLLMLAVLIALIVVAVKFLKSRNIIPVILALATLSLFSCKKESNNTQDIVKALGMKNARLVSSTPSSVTPANYATFDQVKAYVKDMQTQELNYATIIKDSAVNNRAAKNIGAAPKDPEPKGVVTMVEVFLISGHWATFTWGINETGSSASGSGSYWCNGFFSGISGVSLGLGWTQTGYSYTNYPGSALIYFTITGTQTYNFVSSGMLNILTGPVILTGIYNINTKKYVLNSQEAHPL